MRKPSAVKALNDQKKCSNCVVCYGHITDTHIESDKIDSEGDRVCPVDAVERKNFSGGLDGMFLYSNDPKLCIACSKCVKRCNEHGTKSMFLAIRPEKQDGGRRKQLEVIQQGDVRCVIFGYVGL